MAGKELTLEELAASANKQPKPQNNTTGPSLGSQAGKPISVGDLATHLRSTNAPTEEEKAKAREEDAPLVRDAINSMTRTLEERKRRIDEELMPIVMANAEEMAIAKANGEDVENTMMGAREPSVEAAFLPDTDDGPDSIEDIAAEQAKEEATDDEFDLDKAIADEGDDEGYEAAPVTNLHHAEEKHVDNAPVKASSVAHEAEPTPIVEVPDDSNELDELMKDLNAADNEVVDDEDTPEEMRERFKEAFESVKVAQDPIDLTKFTIRREAVSSNAVLKTVDSRGSKFRRADWVLFHTGRSMTFSECSGPELDSLRRNIQNSNGTNGVVISLRFIYDHTIDANKPDFEAWCKLIRTEDIESLYFGLYRACYSGSNLDARECVADGCKKTSLIDTDINKMVKFADDETKQKFDDLFNHDTTSDSHNFESQLMQISDDFVVSYSPATLYSTFIQYATLKPEIQQKYGETLNHMAYIDGFYLIDRETNTLKPIAIRQYPNNLNKTVLSKLKVYTDILKRLTNDQYNILVAKLNNVINVSKVTYVHPECKCPECGATIPESEIDSVLQMLFTRAQLVQIKSL